MEKVDIFDQEVGRAAIECNGNLVVVFNGKKAFWFKEQIESFVKEHPEAPLPLSVFCVAVSKVGEPCKYKSTGNSLIFLILAITIHCIKYHSFPFTCLPKILNKTHFPSHQPSAKSSKHCGVPPMKALCLFRHHYQHRYYVSTNMPEAIFSLWLSVPS